MYIGYAAAAVRAELSLSAENLDHNVLYCCGVANQGAPKQTFSD